MPGTVLLPQADSPENDIVVAPETTDPYAGTLLGQYSAEMRALILKDLDSDRNPEDEISVVEDDADIQAETVETVDFGLHTYSPDMQQEILSSLHDEDASFPGLPTPDEQAAAEAESAARLLSYLATRGGSPTRIEAA